MSRSTFGNALGTFVERISDHARNRLPPNVGLRQSMHPNGLPLHLEQPSISAAEGRFSAAEGRFSAEGFSAAEGTCFSAAEEPFPDAAASFIPDL